MTDYRKLYLFMYQLHATPKEVREAEMILMSIPIDRLTHLDPMHDIPVELLETVSTQSGVSVQACEELIKKLLWWQYKEQQAAAREQ